MSESINLNSLVEVYDNLLLSASSNSEEKERLGKVDESLVYLRNLLAGATLGGLNMNEGKSFIKLQNRVELNALESTRFNSLALPLLDLLLTSFVDSPVNAQLFESTGGLEILIRAMKKKDIRKEVRVKVLETVWGWWIDEENISSTTDDDPQLRFPPSMLIAHSSSNLKSFNNPQDSDSSLDRNRSRFISNQSPQINSPKTQTRSNPTKTKHSKRVSLESGSPISTPTRKVPDSGSKKFLVPKTASRSDRLSEDFKKPSSKLNLDILSSNSSPRARSSGLNQSRSDNDDGEKARISSPAMSKSSSGGTGAALRVPKSSDPASRLRQMLENAAGEFVPATPHHNRVRPTTPIEHDSPSRFRALNRSHPAQVLSYNSPRGAGYRSEGRTDEEDESEGSEKLDSTPTTNKFFITKHRRALAKDNTPQRMLRHKQSASLSSIQDRLTNDTPVKIQPSKLNSDSSDNRVSGSDQPQQPRRNRTDSRLRAGTPPPILNSSNLKDRARTVQVSTPRSPFSNSTPRSPRIVVSNRRGISSGSESENITTTTTSNNDKKLGNLSKQDETLETPRASSSATREHHQNRTNSNALTPMRSTVGRSLGIVTNSAGNMLVSPGQNKNLLIRPSTPNMKINQDDLEMMINEVTDGDSSEAIRRLTRSDKENAREERRLDESNHDVHHPREKGTKLSEDRDGSQIVAENGSGNLNGKSSRTDRKKNKEEILEKYMSNSDQLVKSFKKIGIGMNK
ncbi:expressed protein [Phakopsora pachyrhizi]|uniref:Expressed protein n=1 Tax=Phakopsora pachyrhizi TaxID=170000 RepID=A0AAV0BVT8_PHAPC|nr:expressed protein [Phakopsora pachyrhizi]